MLGGASVVTSNLGTRTAISSEQNSTRQPQTTSGMVGPIYPMTTMDQVTIEMATISGKGPPQTAHHNNSVDS